VTRPQLLAVFGIFVVLWTGVFVVSLMWITAGEDLGQENRVMALVMWWLIVPYLSWSGVLLTKWALK